MNEILAHTESWFEVLAPASGMLERARVKINSGALDSDLDPDVAAKLVAISVLEDIAAQAQGLLQPWQADEAKNLSQF